MIAIIAEKPSLARNIVAGIGEMKKKNGYFENADYIVTWAFGHLFTLCDVEEYSDTPVQNKKWSLDNLPCFPKEFKFKLKFTGETWQVVKSPFFILNGCTRIIFYIAK